MALGESRRCRSERFDSLRGQPLKLATRPFKKLRDHLFLNRVGLARKSTFEALNITPQDETPHGRQH